MTPGSTFARLTKVGFSKISVDFRSGGYRVSARRAVEETAKERPAATSATA